MHQQTNNDYHNEKDNPYENNAFSKSLRLSNLFDLLRRPDVGYADLMGMDGGKHGEASLVSRETLGDDFEVLVSAAVEQVEIAAKYSGYIDRQKGDVERAAHYESLQLPPDLDYMQVTALSMEARQRLSKHRPETLGLASRMTGITPATISLLMIHLKKSGMKGFATLPRGDVAEAQKESA